MKRKVLLFLVALFSTMQVVFSQTPADSITIVNTEWKVTSLQKGVVCKQAEIPLLYNVPQNISILEIDPKMYKFDVAISFPKAETSVAAESTNAIAAINGSYFNVKVGNSVCYLRQEKAVVDTTTADEFRLRVTGAVKIKKGKVELIPWNKGIETAYKEKKGTVLASGPLMLYDGGVCDFSTCSKGFIDTKHPRSAIAKTKSGKILLIAVDGRFPGKAEGINIPELAHFIRVLGGEEALNLDGGGSTTLWADTFPDNGIINKPSDNKEFDNKGERKVANSVCVYKK